MAAVILVASAVVLGKVKRDREWEHGGDEVKFAVQVALTVPDSFDDVAVSFGMSPGSATQAINSPQHVMVRLGWTRADLGPGSFQLIALDARISPGRPLEAVGGWSSDAFTGPNWASAYDELPQRYPWLQGLPSAASTFGSGSDVMPLAAIDVRASEQGTLVGWFRQRSDETTQFADVANEVTIAVFFVGNDGGVRWARRLYG